MSLKGKLLSILAAIVMLAVIIGVSSSGLSVSEKSAGSLFSRKQTLNLWYTDDSLTDYLNQVAVKYNESQNKYRVEPTLMDGVEYLEAINKASVNDDDYPDIYVITNDSLERAEMAGLASEITDKSHFSDNSIFPQSAIDAVSYQGKIVAYPFYFEAASFLYNVNYLQAMADAAEIPVENAVPKTMTDILKLANTYDAPAELESVFAWDINDIFYNYYFVGNSMNVGGPSGDDVNQFDVYNEESIKSLKAFQKLNQFFSIDTETVDYESVIDDFASGKIAFTVATSDAVNTLKEKTEDGTMTAEYGVSKIPDITTEMQTKTMSVTNCLVVNGYSNKRAAANRFIGYMLYDHNTDFYDRTGKALAQSGYVYSDSHMDGFYDAYVDSVPITKMREASNFWMLLENAFSKVWNGADANATLKSLYESTMLQFTGQEVTVEALPEPDISDINAELTGGD